MTSNTKDACKTKFGGLMHWQCVQNIGCSVEGVATFPRPGSEMEDSVVAPVPYREPEP